MISKPVQHEQADTGFRNSAHERLISRVLFRSADAQLHQTSIYSTLPLDALAGTIEHSQRIEQFKAIYAALGCTVLRMEFVDQVGWEL